jgi:hypothetical protein
VLNTYIRPLTTSRTLTVRLPPPRFAGGMTGAMKAQVGARMARVGSDRPCGLGEGFFDPEAPPCRSKRTRIAATISRDSDIR